MGIGWLEPPQIIEDVKTRVPTPTTLGLSCGCHLLPVYFDKLLVLSVFLSHPGSPSLPFFPLFLTTISPLLHFPRSIPLPPHHHLFSPPPPLPPSSLPCLLQQKIQHRHQHVCVCTCVCVCRYG